MEDKIIIEFFPNFNFRGCQFFFYCPKMAQKDKILISEYIKKYDGVRKFYNDSNFFNLKYSQFPLLSIRIQ